MSGFPSFLQIEPAGTCNLRCPMCAVALRNDADGRTPPLMPFALFRRIVDDTAGVRQLHLQGMGEPLLNPRFFDMAEYAAGRGIAVTANTNGTLMDRAAAERCAAGGLAELYVSVDSATKRTYESIRRGASFEKLLLNIAALNRALKKSGGRKLKLIFVTVLMKRNVAELPSILALAKRFSAAGVYTQQLCHNFTGPSLRARCGPIIGFIEKETLLGGRNPPVAETFAAARRTAERMGIELHLPKERRMPHAGGASGRSWCDWPWKGLYIGWQGEIMPCCMAALPGRYSLGTVRQLSPGDMEKNRRLMKLRRDLSSGIPPPMCAACPMHYGMF